ncbi:MAG: hypothetical protein QF580_05345, partial [Gammaproteobacteria bacterium]|nr:hypothetical protein [Gammaproteobacteria bacterium]
MNYLRLISSLLVGALMLTACAETGNKSGSLTKYSYEGAPLTVFTGVKPPWNKESRLTGYFIHEELAPNATYDFLDPDIEFPFVNLPSEFSFSDGARTITHTQ